MISSVSAGKEPGRTRIDCAPPQRDSLGRSGVPRASRATLNRRSDSDAPEPALDGGSVAPPELVGKGSDAPPLPGPAFAGAVPFSRGEDAPPGSESDSAGAAG